MHNIQGDIDNIFTRKFENYQLQTSETEWVKLSAKLTKLNFLKFSFASFNVYYLTVLVGLAATTTFTTISNFNLQNKVRELNHKIELQNASDKTMTIDSTIVNSSAITLESLTNNNTSGSPAENKKTTDRLNPQTGNQKITSSVAPLANSRKISNAKHNSTIITNAPVSNNLLTADTIKPINKETFTVSEPSGNTPDTTQKVKRIKKQVVIIPQSVIKRDTLVINKKKK